MKITCTLIGLLLNLLLLWACSAFGIGLSTDAANYVSAAENFVNGKGLVQYDSFALLNTPPLFVLVLSLAFVFKIDPLIWGLIINLIALNLCLLAVYKLVNRSNYGDISSLVLVFCFVGYWSFIYGFQYLLSEGLFMALLMLFVHRLLKESEENITHYWSAILFMAVCSTRYAGYMMAPGLIIYMVYRRWSIKTILQFFIPTIIFTLLWFIRNHQLSGQILGGHQLGLKFGLVSIVENIGKLDRRLILIGALFISTLLILLLKKVSWSELFWLNATLSFSYLILLLVQPGLNTNQLSRYLAIIEMPFAFLIVEMVLKATRSHYLPYFILLLGSLVKVALLVYKAYISSLNGAGGFHQVRWQDPMMHTQIKEISSEAILSNCPDFIYWIRKEKAYYFQFNGENEGVFLSRVPKGGKLIWFKSPERDQIFEKHQERGEYYSVRTEKEEPLFYQAEFTTSKMVRDREN